MKWISVKDKLPEKSNHKKTANVLLWCPQQPNMPWIIGYGLIKNGVNYPYEIDVWKSIDASCNIIYGEVTHWMPLPKFPE